MEVKDAIYHKLQKYYGYEAQISLIDIEEYDIKGERPTQIMSL